MLVGEIGIPRKEFLYEVDFWEVRRIIRGFRRRNILQYQLLRLCAYSSFFSMRANKSGKGPEEWLPLDFDRTLDEESGEGEDPITEEEAERLRQMIRDINEKRGK